VSPTSAFSRFAFGETPQGNVRFKVFSEFLTWLLKRDWIVTFLVRREKFVTTFRPDLLSEHCFGSVGQTFLQNLTWSFG
jgi:hypothetical protein